MTKIIFTAVFTFLLLLANFSFSQNVEFPEYDAFWKEQTSTLLGTSNRLTAICKDTTFNSLNYKQVKSYWLEMGTDSLLGPASNIPTFIRSEGQQVYVVYDASDELLLYDFSLEEGDSIVVDIWNFPKTMKVDSVRYETIAGLNRKIIYFKVPPFEPLEFWVEGIGSNYGLLDRGFFAIDAESRLLCFEHLDQSVNFTLIECFFPDAPTDCSFPTASEHVFAEKLELNIYPNPSSEIINVSVAGKINRDYSVHLFSYMGTGINAEVNRQANNFTVNISELNAGIYFVEIMDEKNRQMGIQKFIKK